MFTDKKTEMREENDKGKPITFHFVRHILLMLIPDIWGGKFIESEMGKGKEEDVSACLKCKKREKNMFRKKSR